MFFKIQIFLLWDLCQFCLRLSQDNVSPSIDQYFWHAMPQFSDTNVKSHIAPWYIMISEICNFFTGIKSQHTLRFPNFYKFFFCRIVYLAWDIFPFLAIILCKPPCSHKFCLLSIKNCLLFSILVYYYSKCSTGFI